MVGVVRFGPASDAESLLLVVDEIQRCAGDVASRTVLEAEEPCHVVSGEVSCA